MSLSSEKMEEFVNEAFEMGEIETKVKKKTKEKEDVGYEYGLGEYIEEEIDGSRPAWDNQVQFLLACIAFAVGLGNIWRFPYLAQKYGGGAFLIPYLLMLVFEGVPLFLIELAIGQRMRCGPIKVWTKFHPYLIGIGFASILTSFLVGLYYNTIVAWCFWYLFNSFTDPLPYAKCPLNANKTAINAICAATGPTEYFWYKDTLDMTASIEETGGLKWWIVLCLILSWVTVWCAMLKGIESSGKVMYFTATFPYVVLIIFLCRGLTLKGSSEGLKYLFTPDLEVLSDPRVWLDAATQIFFSLSVGFGGVIAFASYNPRKQDCQRDVLIISFVNSFTSIFASIVIFSVLGYKAAVKFDTCVESNIQIMLDVYNLPESYIDDSNYYLYEEKYNNETHSTPLEKCDLNAYLNEQAEGTGLAFVVFTEAIINMPGSPVWSVLFFLMLLSLGLGTMFGTIEGVMAPLNDLGLKLRKEVTIGIIAFISCCLGLIFTTGAGNYWLTIFNDYAGSIPLLVVTFSELVVVTFAYGTRRFDEDLTWMIGGPKTVMGWILHYYFRICWTFLSPIILLVVFVAYIYVTASSSFDYTVWRGLDPDELEQKTLLYPWFGVMVILLLIILPLICIPLVWIIRYILHKRNDDSENKGVLCDKPWTFNNLMFWKNKYDKDGNLIF